MVVDMKNWKAHSAMKIEYVHKTMLGTKYIRKNEVVSLPDNSIVSIEFNPVPLTKPESIPGYKSKPFIEAETFPQLWQAGRRHSMETIIGNLEDLDLNPTSERI